MGIDVHQIHNVVRTYQRALQPAKPARPVEPVDRALHPDRRGAVAGVDHEHEVELLLEHLARARELVGPELVDHRPPAPPVALLALGVGKGHRDPGPVEEALAERVLGQPVTRSQSPLHDGPAQGPADHSDTIGRGAPLALSHG